MSLLSLLLRSADLASGLGLAHRGLEAVGLGVQPVVIVAELLLLLQELTRLAVDVELVGRRSAAR